jgi:hypothetical protein
VLGALAPPTLDEVLVTTVSEVGIVLLLFTHVQRKRSASVNEKPTPNAPRRRRSPRTWVTQAADTSAHACAASSNDAVRGRSQPLSRKPPSRLLRARRGSARISPAAAIPTRATKTRPSRTPSDWPGRMAAARAKGASQRDTVDQTEHEERKADRSHACRATPEAANDRNAHDIVDPPGKRERRDGRPPFVAASASVCGRSCVAKSRRHRCALST